MVLMHDVLIATHWGRPKRTGPTWPGTTDAEESIMFQGFALDEKLATFEDLLLDTLQNPTYNDLAHLDTLVQMVR